MKKWQRVLKEIGLDLLLLVIVVLVTAGIFANKNLKTFTLNIPEPEVYASIDKDDYLVANDGIENAQAETVVYQSTTNDLEMYGSDYRYSTGTTEPFTNSNATTPDIPTDVITPKTETETRNEATTQEETEQ